MKKLLVLLAVATSLALLACLTAHAATYPLVYTKTQPHNFHGGECFTLILRALRGTEPEGGPSGAFTTGIPGVTIELLDQYGREVVWHDSVTGCAIKSGGENGFDFTVTKNGKVIMTAKWVDHGKTTQFILKPLVPLPIK